MHVSGTASSTDAGAVPGANKWGWGGLQNSMMASFLWACTGGYNASILWALPSVEGQGPVLSRVLS